MKHLIIISLFLSIASAGTMKDLIIKGVASNDNEFNYCFKMMKIKDNMIKLSKNNKLIRNNLDSFVKAYRVNNITDCLSQF